MKVGQYAILTDNSNGVVTITLPDANGTLQTIKLPTALAAITGIEIMKLAIILCLGVKLHLLIAIGPVLKEQLPKINYW